MLLLLAGIGSLPTILVYVLVIGLFLAGLYFIINKFFPEPIKGYATAIVIVVAIILLIIFLLSLVGTGPRLNLS